MTPAERIAALDARLYATDPDATFLADLYDAANVFYQTDEGRAAFMDWIDIMEPARVIQVPYGDRVTFRNNPGREQRLLALLAVSIPLISQYPEWYGRRSLFDATYMALSEASSEFEADDMLERLGNDE